MEKLDQLLDESIAEIERLGIKPSRRIYGIKVNNRAKKRLGCCKKVWVNMVRGFQLEVSSRLLNNDERQLREVIIHEVLHTCKGCFNHGKLWKEYAKMINQTYGYHVSRTADCHAVEGVYRYQIVCKNCGNEIFRVRKSKVVSQPENYRCGKCKGTLEVRKYEEVLSSRK